MKVEYVLTPECIKAMWNHFRGYTTLSIANARVLYLAAPTISLTLLLTGGYSGNLWLQSMGRTLLFGTLVSIPIHIAYDKWKFSNWFKNNFSLDPEKESYSLIANDEGIIVAKSDSIESRVTWNAITDFRQDETITIVYLSPDNCFYFPTKSMSADQSAELHDLIARHVPKGKP
jgi:hypothetical protein